MRAIDRVQQALRASGLKGKVTKTYYKMLMGYWFWPKQSKAIYLGASAEVAIVAIDALRWKEKHGHSRVA